MLYIITTLLQLIFGFGCLFGFYVLFGILMGDREKWQFIYIISLVILFFIIAVITPEGYKNPFVKGEPSIEDYERGYRPPPGRQYDHLP